MLRRRLFIGATSASFALTVLAMAARARRRWTASIFVAALVAGVRDFPGFLSAPAQVPTVATVLYLSTQVPWPVVFVIQVPYRWSSLGTY